MKKKEATYFSILEQVDVWYLNNLLKKSEETNNKIVKGVTQHGKH